MSRRGFAATFRKVYAKTLFPLCESVPTLELQKTSKLPLLEPSPFVFPSTKLDSVNSKQERNVLVVDRTPRGGPCSEGVSVGSADLVSTWVVYFAGLAYTSMLTAICVTIDDL